MTSLDRLKAEIRAEFEATGTVTAAAWLNDDVAQDHRAEVEEYIRLLTGKLDLQARSPLSRWTDGGAGVKALVARTLSEIERERQAELADAVAAERVSAVKLRVENFPPAEVRGTLYGLAVFSMLFVRQMLTRMDIQKGVYLTLAGIGYRMPVAYEANRWGPHSPELTIDGEAFGKAQGWFDVVGQKVPMIAPKPRLEGAHAAASRILGDPSVAERLLRQLAAYSTHELETLATLHWCLEHLIASHERVTEQSVIRALRREKKFKNKEKQPNFSVAEIRKGLERLRTLGLIDPARLAG